LFYVLSTDCRLSWLLNYIIIALLWLVFETCYQHSTNNNFIASLCCLWSVVPPFVVYPADGFKG